MSAQEQVKPCVPSALRWYTLDQVRYGFEQGTVSREDAATYCAAWNATPGRFTQAEVRDGSIRQRLIP